MNNQTTKQKDKNELTKLFCASFNFPWVNNVKVDILLLNIISFLTL